MSTAPFIAAKNFGLAPQPKHGITSITVVPVNTPGTDLGVRQTVNGEVWAQVSVTVPITGWTPLSNLTETPVNPPSNSSGIPMPVGDLPGWTQVFTDDFTTNTPLGSFPQAVADKWAAYPYPWQDTDKDGSYDPAKTVSISNSMMNIFLHTVNGEACVAAPMPIIIPHNPNNPQPPYDDYGQGQLYGKFTVCARFDSVSNHHAAWLLWPNSGVWPGDGEIDYPEFDLTSTTVNAFMHRQNGINGSDQDVYSITTAPSGWHVYDVEWLNESLTFRLDGVVVGHSTARVPNTPMHWVLQTETAGVPTSTSSGYVQVDWVTAYTPIVTVPPTGPVPNGIPGNWTVVFEDEFDAPTLDNTKWNPNWLGASNQITPPVNSSETACYDPAQVSIVNSELQLTAIVKPQTINGKLYPYSSGMVETNGKFNFTYGCVEARMWLPAGVGEWPAFWTDGQSWPTDGEIDIVEAYGTDTSPSPHYHYSGGGPGIDNVNVPGSTSGWHTYAADWEPGVITWYYDGKQVWQYTTGIVNTPNFLILNLALKSNPATVPSVLRVDYVRIWKKA